MAISRMQQPRQMYQEGGIMPRLNQLGTGVSSAEQMLQGINQRLESAESSLGEGGGNTAPIGSGPMQLAGGATQQPAFGSMEEAYSSFQDKAKDIRAGGMLGRVILPGEMSFQDFSNNMNLNTGLFGMHGAGGVPVGGNNMQSPLATAMRNMAAGGGIMSLEPRQQYGLGSFVKSVTKGAKKLVSGAVDTVKDFAKSDLGKAAMLAAISFGIPGAPGAFGGGLFGRASMFGPAKGLFGYEGIGPTFGAFKSTPFGEAIFGKAIGDTDMTRTGGLLKNKLFQGAAAGTVLGSVLGGGLPSDEGATVGGERNISALRTRLEKAYRELRYPEEEIPALVEADLAEYTSGAGGYADGGRIGYAFGNNNPEQNAINAAGIMGIPLNQNPAGATELDMRDTGGFIPPVGVKEKADDIPAMLSNNEFVFTADAVRGMGDGDVNVGAQRMYDMMKKLENGGRV